MKSVAAAISILLAVELVTAFGQGAAPRKALNGAPKVSPDGSAIAFRSDRTGTNQVYVMRSDGSDQHPVTNEPDGASVGGWSSDGKSIVYQAGRGDSRRLCVMNADGTEKRILTKMPADSGPGWGPDDSILFSSGTFPVGNIHIMNSKGTERRNLSPASTLDYDPAWSAGRHAIAFVSGSLGQGGPRPPKLYVMNEDGAARRQLSFSDGAHERPEWSRDSNSIAYQVTAPDRKDTHIHIIDVTSGNDRRITQHDHPYHDETPSWFPDGRRLAIQSDRDGRWSIYVIDLGGKMLGQLTP